MSAASNYLEDKLLDHTLRGTAGAYTAPSTVYVALFASGGNDSALTNALETGTSSTSGTGNWGYYEINNGLYARQSVSFGAAGTAGGYTTGTIKNNATVSFDPANADYDTAGSTGNVVTHIAIMDNSSGASTECLYYGLLSTSKTVSSGDQFTISSGNLAISLA